jgi:Staygreen protein
MNAPILVSLSFSFEMEVPDFEAVQDLSINACRYVRLLRDEVLAEWLPDDGRTEPAVALHVTCHVSGQERWLAPPALRDRIFRREMPLVGVWTVRVCMDACV